MVDGAQTWPVRGTMTLCPTLAASRRVTDAGDLRITDAGDLRVAVVSAASVPSDGPSFYRVSIELEVVPDG